MSSIPAKLNLLDDVTHQSYPHPRLLVELMTHIQCESKPIKITCIAYYQLSTKVTIDITKVKVDIL